jgi:L-ascorbate metabolism protein UlaG (beta-lactamase superfamily)
LSDSHLSITWIGHATALIEIEGVRILTDPALRDRIGPLRRYGPRIRPEWLTDIDAVIISHAHRDHLDPDSLKLLGGNPRHVVPEGAAAFMRSSGLLHVDELLVGEATTVAGVNIQAIHAEHGGFRLPFGPSASAIGYVVSATHRVYFGGDTAIFQGMADLKGEIDVALLPVGGWGVTRGRRHLNAKTAVEALKLISPRLVVPIHWGTLWPVGLRIFRPSLFSSPGPDFAARARALTPEVEVELMRPGGKVDLHT